MNLDYLLFELAAFFYFISAVLYILYLFKTKNYIAKLSFRSILIAFITHGVSFLIRGIQVKHFPVTTLFESLSFYSWLLAGGFIIMQLKYKLPVVGTFVAPLNLTMVIWALLFPSPQKPLPPALKSNWLFIHALTSFIGEAAFALSFAVSVVYLIQEKQIKAKKVGFLFRKLPALNTLDEINYRILTIGFPFLTIGIITGAVWANYAWGSYWSWDPKETWSLITWLVYAGILHGRLTIGWRGRRAAIFSIIGFGCVVFTFLGVNLLLPGLHSYARM